MRGDFSYLRKVGNCKATPVSEAARERRVPFLQHLSLPHPTLPLAYTNRILHHDTCGHTLQRGSFGPDDPVSITMVILKKTSTDQGSYVVR